MVQMIYKLPNLSIDKINLTKREKEVLEYICIGDTNSEIGEKLQLSPKTIEAYKTKLLSKTKTRNSAHLVMVALVNKIVEV